MTSIKILPGTPKHDILASLKGNPSTAQALMSALGLAKSSVSRHLNWLHVHGMVYIEDYLAPAEGIGRPSAIYGITEAGLLVFAGKKAAVAVSTASNIERLRNRQCRLRMRVKELERRVEWLTGRLLELGGR